MSNRPRVSALFAGGLMLVAVAASVFAENVDPSWKRVLTGDIVAMSVSDSGAVYVVTDDRSITALDETGKFLWSRNLPGKPASACFVSSEGTVLAATVTGTLVAYNANGSFLWQSRAPSAPVVSPYEGRDGRIFVRLRDRLLCLSGLGARKWSLPLAGNPSGALGETADGDVLLPCGDSVARVSPFGELLETIPIQGELTAICSLPGGFAAGFRDGAVRAYDVRSSRAEGRPLSEVVWEFRASGAVIALTAHASTLAVASANGEVSAVNVTDGAKLWVSPDGFPATAGELSLDYGEFVLSTPIGLLGLNLKGRTVWRLPLPRSVILPALSPTGFAFSTGSDWLLRAWKAEERVKIANAAKNGQNYGILSGYSATYGLPSGPLGPDSLTFFSEVDRALQEGTIGDAEIAYARRLIDMIENAGDGGYGRAITYSDGERARAATLLGKMGSREYRAALTRAAARADTPTLAIGVLFALAACPPDEKALAAIDSLVYRFSSVDATGQYASVYCAACDALYAALRYAPENAEAAARSLSAFLDGRYGSVAAEYARRTLENVLK